MNVPKLRFKEFNDEYKYEPLSNYVERIITKNKNNVSNLVLTISAQFGLVDQTRFFNKNVSSNNLAGYYLLNKGDFAYNKSYSNGYPWGAIKRLNKYDMGVVSSLYICFKPNKKINSDYLEQYFETNKWYHQMSEVSVEGARNHGLLNIAVGDFFSTEHFIPTLDEQKKISKFLSLLDKKIELQSKKIEDLKLFKKGLLNKLVDDIVTNQKCKLSDLGNSYSGVSGKTKEDFNCGDAKYIPFMNVLRNNIDIINLPNINIGLEEKQNEVKNGDLFFTVSSETKEEVGMCATLKDNVKKVYLNSFCFGFRIKDKNIIDNEFLCYLLLSEKYRKIISNLGQGFTRVNISKNQLLDIVIEIPRIDIQKKISKTISSLERHIKLEINILNILIKLKKGFMQNMFV